MKVFIVRIPEGNSYNYALECAQSCEEHGVAYEYFEGIYGKTYDELKQLFPKLYFDKFDNPNSITGRIANCLAGNYYVFQKCIESNEPCVWLEHDIIVKTDFTKLDIDINENALYALTPKVLSRNDYKFPKNLKLTPVINYLHDISNAKIVTPQFCREFFKLSESAEPNDIQWYWLQTPDNINGLLNFKNNSGYVQYVIDPFPAVCEISDRTSNVEILDKNNAFSNWSLPVSFYKNLTVDKEYYHESIRWTYRNPKNVTIYRMLKSLGITI